MSVRGKESESKWESIIDAWFFLLFSLSFLMHSLSQGKWRDEPGEREEKGLLYVFVTAHSIVGHGVGHLFS